jgi:hypothetical protein
VVYLEKEPFSEPIGKGRRRQGPIASSAPKAVSLMSYLARQSFAIICLLFFVVPIVFSQSEESFIQKAFYAQRVIIENPEDSILAEMFLRRGISVAKPAPGTQAFTFRTRDDDEKFLVFIYYCGDFVGKYFYTKKGGDRDEKEFFRSFVDWMFENAWKVENPKSKSRLRKGK